jgi:hypothetical protein
MGYHWSELAEFERELIRERTGEGRKRAMDRDVRFGRPRKLTPFQRQEAIARLDAGETQADVARSYGVDLMFAAVAMPLSVLAAYGGLSLALLLATGRALLH